MTLIEFLLARIDEDERIVRAFDTDPLRIYENRRGLPLRLDRSELRLRWYELLQGRQYREARARVVAECDSKRRIVAVCEDDLGGRRDGVLDGDDGSVTWRVLTALALPYADHPDYREEWRT